MATYWVEAGHGGTDSGTEANPWLTIDQAMNAVGDGDKVWIKASASYAEMPQIDTAASGETVPIVFEGYTTSTGDGGRITINASGNNYGINNLAGAGSLFYVFKNINVQTSTSHAFNMGTGDFVTFKNCLALNAGGAGFNGDNGCMFERCESQNAGSIGFNCDAAAIFINCVAHQSAGVGFYAQFGNCAAYGCLAYDNAANDGMSLGDAAGLGVVINCTFDGENTGDDGITFPSTSRLTAVVNCILYDWADGIDAVTSIGELAISLGNLYNSNTNNTANYIEGDLKVEDVPGFTNEAGDDYTLASGSAAKAAGYDAAGSDPAATSYVDIGALQRQEAGGGGGLLVHPGTSGGARG